MAEFSDRQPLATYEQAVWRLAQFEVASGHTADQITLAVQIVADTFWFSDDKVRYDMRKACRSIGHGLPPPRRSRVLRSAHGVLHG